MSANEWVDLIGNIANTATGVASNVINLANGTSNGTESSSAVHMQPQQTTTFQIPKAVYYVAVGIGGLLLIKALK